MTLTFELHWNKTTNVDFIPNANDFKPIFEHLNVAINYGKLRIALAVLR